MQTDRIIALIVIGSLLAGIPNPAKAVLLPGAIERFLIPDTPMPEPRQEILPDWSLPPYDPDGMTNLKRAQQAAAAYTRQWQEAHNQYGQPIPEYEDALATFFEKMGAWHEKLPNAESVDTLLSEAEQLHAIPCNDPAFLYTYGLLLKDKKRYNAAVDRFLEAAALFDQRNYPAILKAYNAVAIHNTVNYTKGRGGDEQQKHWQFHILEFMAQALAHDDLTVADLRPIWSHISDNWNKIYSWVNKEKQHLISLRIEELGDGEPWLTTMLKAKHHLSMGWSLRGGGFANTVTEEGWIGFAENLEKADFYFREALKIQPTLPEPIADLLTITGTGHGSGPETTFDWFLKGLECQIDYYPLYSSFLWYTLPRWGGTPRQLIAFLELLVDSDLYQTRVPTFILWLYKTVASDRLSYPRSWEYSNMAGDPWRDPRVWGIYQKMYEGYLDQPQQIPPPLDAQKLLAEYIDYAHQFDQPEDLIRILTEYPREIDFSPGQFAEQYGYTPAFAKERAQIQIETPVFNELIQAIDNREFAKATRLLKELEEQYPKTQTLEKMRRTLHVRADLEPDENWENYTSTDLSRFYDHRGTSRRSYGDSLYLQAKDQGRNIMILRSGYTGNREIAVDATILADQFEDSNSVAVYLSRSGFGFIVLVAYPERGEAVLSYGQRDIHRAEIPKQKPGHTYRLRMRVEDKLFTAWVDGEPVFEQITFPAYPLDDKFYLGFGNRYPAPPSPILIENVRFRDLNILTDEEAP